MANAAIGADILKRSREGANKDIPKSNEQPGNTRNGSGHHSQLNIRSR